MKLNVADARMIQRLKRREHSWRSARWAVLSIGIVMLCGSAFMFQRIWSTVAYDQLLLVLCVLISPVSGVVLFVSLAFILYVFALWNGRPIDKLLVKLANEVESRGNQQC
jgi:hypothetical protein